MSRKDLMEQKTKEALIRVLSKHEGWVSATRIYNEFYDEMRSIGIKATIPSRRQFSMFTTNQPTIAKEQRFSVITGRKEMHYRIA
jgi:hypothetical protein